MNYIQPSIELWNIRIDEPITTLTDLILAGICFYAYFRIKQVKSKGRIKWYFKYYFLMLGFGAFFGGILGHAFLYGLSPSWKLLSWVFTLISVALFVQALLEVTRPLVNPRFTRIIVRLNFLVFVVALVFILLTLNFFPVKYYSILGMVAIVGSLSVYIIQKSGSRWAMKFLLAVGLGLASALIFSYGWGVGPWFNHQDISHVILSFSALTFYKGAILILDAQASRS